MSITPIRLGIIGAGTFSRDAHVPALLQLNKYFEVIAVCDQDLSVAQAVSEKFKDVKIFNNFIDLLNEPEIEAVDIVLPPQLMPQIIKKALEHDKHIISEKPVSLTAAEGRELINFHERYPNLIWEVAENWRHEKAIIEAARAVKNGVLGRVVLFHWQIYYPIRPGHRYFQTGWRRSENFPGGYIFDGGVHHVAAIRKILGEVFSVSAMSELIHEDLGCMDTASINMKLMNGIIGNYLVTYAVGSPWKSMLNIVGDKGCMMLDRQELTLFAGDDQQNVMLERGNAFRDEFIDFHNAITTGSTLVNKPIESLKDVAVMEAVMKSLQSTKQVDVEFVN